ncbi:MAG TPA: alanine-zipper protein, partial [Arachidicoccus sp.]|nr:alanine-zipper protein [Arachidicoccus sp.]
NLSKMEFTMYDRELRRRWDVFASDQYAEKQRRKEIDKAQKEAEEAQREAEKAQCEAEKAQCEAEKAQCEAEKAQCEAQEVLEKLNGAIKTFLKKQSFSVSEIATLFQVSEATVVELQKDQQ